MESSTIRCCVKVVGRGIELSPQKKQAVYELGVLCANEQSHFLVLILSMVQSHIVKASVSPGFAGI